ncbi:sulfatase [Rubritalea tangerina]|uniref:Sulfatase n=1 Tax=Rubritalea tangerina TaxID=430798 RepID=A0ABW4ZEE3_9BACT
MKLSLITLTLTTLAAVATPPNIMVIVADDLGYGDLGITKHPKIKTPHLDALANQGALFHHFYSPAQVCSPSRAAMITGRMPHRMGIYSFIGGSSGNLTHIPKSETTLPQLLKKQGYQTAIVGKWHNSLNDIQAKNPAIPSMSHYGFDYWFCSDDNAKILNKPNWRRNGKNEGVRRDLAANVVADETIHWLTNKRKPNTPFIQFVHFYEPHWRIEAPKPLVDSYLENATNNKNEAIYFAAVSNVDKQIGRILTCLDKLNLADNTAVFFSSDHGPAKLGKGHSSDRSYGTAAPYRGNKYGLWDGSIHVPGIVRWPLQIQAGHEVHTPAGSIDWFPTILAMTNTPLPKKLEIDGANHLPLLLGKPFSRNKPLQWHHYNTNVKNAPNPNAVMRKGDFIICGFYDPSTQLAKASWKEAHLSKVKTGKLTRFSLYNLKSDPKQKHDISGQHPQLFSQLKKQLIKAHLTMQKQAIGWKGTQTITQHPDPTH